MEIEALLRQQGEAFEAFKKSHDEQIAEVKKSGSNDPILLERLSKIEGALDKAVEAKAAIDAAMAAEKKHVDELEKLFNRHRIGGSGGDDSKRELELKLFNATLEAYAAEQKRTFVPLDDKGYGEYKTALNTWLRKGDKFLGPDEVKTLQVGIDSDGGYLVTPDMSGRIVKRQFETSPMRQIASQVTISTDAIEGLEDIGEAGAGYAGEAAQGSDTTTPTLGRWRIPVHWIDTEPKATQQVLDDAAIDVEAWLANKVADKFSRFENAEFVTGAAAKIRGITGGGYTFSADSGSGVTWPAIGYVYTGVAGAFAAANPADKLHDLIGCVKSNYLNNARFLTRRTVITLIRKFKDGVGTYLWQPSFSQGVPEQIMGYPVTRAEDMPAVATDSYSLGFGDWMEAYQIVDRQGIRVLRDPYTAKPFVKFYTTKRVGGGYLNYEAVKFLKFGTS